MASRVTAIGFQYGVAVLRKKRAELDGEIGQLKLMLRDRRRELGKLDDILRILAPAIDPRSIPPKKAMKYLNIFRQGELGRLIIAVLRNADHPMTNIEIARVVMQRGGYRPLLWNAIRRRTRANLAYLEKQERALKIGFGPTAEWSMSPDT